ncbi:DUF3426 domain-containing protein [Endozoicomonas elysicola]|uniref:DUF3426 domain-containing protein n=1 Tax=Endozoicomonas elysicola TaxID=305900 RepID=UPI00037BEA98|nr:DUF3426 domain-containing protein [Endozoicomonas elysicola]
MTPSSVTCPHCQTTFRITNAQLKAANGSVRCGSCLQVFNALDQVERPKEQEKVKETVKALEENTTPHQTEAPVAAQPRQQPPEKLVVQQHKPVKKPESSQPQRPKAKELDPSVKAKVATAPMEYDGYHQQSIETLIQELDERETEEAISEQQRRRKRTYWGFAACALMLMLVLQFAWFNRNTLSLTPSLRPAYAIACNLFPCTLPPLVDIQAIRSVDLVVRSHPNQDNALQIDAVIINEAKHPQPFPDLELTFTDINGRLVANRTFTPFEYLGGELAGSEEMPKAQPIRLGLEIIDPGERAVNYQLTFSENKMTRFN